MSLILIADDQRDVLEALRILLKSDGHQTDAVTSLVRELLGSEGWMETTMVDGLLAYLLELLGLRSERAPSTRHPAPSSSPPTSAAMADE